MEPDGKDPTQMWQKTLEISFNEFVSQIHEVWVATQDSKLIKTGYFPERISWLDRAGVWPIWPNMLEMITHESWIHEVCYVQKHLSTEYSMHTREKATWRCHGIVPEPYGQLNLNSRNFENRSRNNKDMSVFSHFTSDKNIIKGW